MVNMMNVVEFSNYKCNKRENILAGPFLSKPTMFSAAIGGQQ